jgi:hypothetical protein
MEEVLKGRKEVYECIITSIYVFDRLEKLHVTGSADGIGGKVAYGEQGGDAGEYRFCRWE